MLRAESSRTDRWSFRAWPALLLAAGLAPAPAAFPQDAPAPPAAAPSKSAPVDPLEAEVEAIHRSVGAGVWRPGKAAIEKFLASHAGDPGVLAHLPGLEADLQACLFRLSGPQPTPVQLLGRGATKYDPASGRAEFRLAPRDGDGGWLQAGEVRFLDVLFDGEMMVEMSGIDALKISVLLGFDSETKGAYAFVPTLDEYGDSRLANIYRVDPLASEPIPLLNRGPLLHDGGYTESVRYALAGGKLTVETLRPRSWTSGNRLTSESVSDSNYRRGFVALQGAERLREAPVIVTGKLEKMFAVRQMAEAETRRFREWRAAKWRREESLPRWVLDLEKASGAWAESLPAGLPPEARGAAVLLQRAAFEGGPEAPVPAGVEGAAGDWLNALSAFRQGRYAAASSMAEGVIAAEPGFAPAHALAGRAFLERGDADEAIPRLRQAVRLDAAFAPAHDGLALAAFLGGDLEGMQRALRDAAAAGGASQLTSRLHRVLMRVRRGPNWKKKFETGSGHFLVSGDSSNAICDQVAKTLEEAFEIYGREFRKRPKLARARVRVFSGAESYADYVSDLGADPSGTLGVYVPALRELCVFLHEDRPELSNTIRHEGFHQYLHGFLESAPIWFNEGYAEFFGFSRRKKDKAVVGQVGGEQAAMARALLPRFTPLARLFRMEPGEFMDGAVVHYVQSWAVIHLLRDPPEPALKGVLDRYFDALLAGKSREEAYEEVLAPVVEPMEKALRAHVEGMGKR